MSLRTRLFLLLGALVALLVVAEGWLVRGLARELSAELSQVAFQVGEGLVAGVVLHREQLEWTATGPGVGAVTRESAGDSRAIADPELATTLHRRFVLRTEHGVKVQADGAAESSGVRPRPHRSDEALMLLPMGERSPGAEPSALERLTPAETFLLVQAARELLERRAPPAGPSGAGRLLERQLDLPLPAETLPPGLQEKLGEHAELVVSVDSASNVRYLHVSGPSLDEKIPIPTAGVDEALQRFRERLLLGSGALLLLGLVLAGGIAHRATMPLRELSAAASAVGAGALGRQVALPGDGEVAAAVAAFNSMSARLAELDRESRALRERRHLAELGEVARGLAHGMRNPLNALGLSLEEMATEIGEPRRAELAESGQRQIRRIDGSIRSFLALASSESAGATETVDLRELIDDLALEVLQDARGRVGVRVEAGPGVQAIRGRRPELRALVQALLVNAVEASPEGGKVRVHLAALGPDEPPGLRIAIEDEGPGLPPEVRERLFLPHVTTKPSGAGMGLFLAHRIATARHGGRLELQDREDGPGTRALLELPRDGEASHG